MKENMLRSIWLLSFICSDVVRCQLSPQFTKRATGADLINLQLLDSLDQLNKVSEQADRISEIVTSDKTSDNLLSIKDIGAALGSLGGLKGLGEIGSSLSGLLPSLGGGSGALPSSPRDSLLPTYVPRSATAAPNNNLLNFHFNFPPGGAGTGGLIPSIPTPIPVANLQSGRGLGNYHRQRPRDVNVHIHNDGESDLSKELLTVLSPNERDLLFNNVRVAEILTRPDPKDPSWRIGNSADRTGPSFREAVPAQPKVRTMQDGSGRTVTYDFSDPTVFSTPRKARQPVKQDEPREPLVDPHELGIRIDSTFDSLRPVIPITDDLTFGDAPEREQTEIPDRVFEVKHGGNLGADSRETIATIPVANRKVEQQNSQSVSNRYQEIPRAQYKIPARTLVPRRSEEQIDTPVARTLLPRRTEEQINTPIARTLLPRKTEERINTPVFRTLLPRRTEEQINTPVVQETISTPSRRTPAEDKTVVSYRDRVLQARKITDDAPKNRKAVVRNLRARVPEATFSFNDGNGETNPANLPREAGLDFSAPIDRSQSTKPGRRSRLSDPLTIPIKSNGHDTRTLDVYSRNLDKDDLRNGERILRVFTPDSPRPDDLDSTLKSIFSGEVPEFAPSEDQLPAHQPTGKLQVSEAPYAVSEDLFLNTLNLDSINQFFNTDLIRDRLPEETPFDNRDSFLPSFPDSQQLPELGSPLISVSSGHQFGYDELLIPHDPAQHNVGVVNEVIEDNPHTQKDEFFQRFDISANDFFPSLVSSGVTHLDGSDDVSESANLYSNIERINPVVPNTDDLFFGSGTRKQDVLKGTYLSSEGEDVEEEEPVVQKTAALTQRRQEVSGKIEKAIESIIEQQRKPKRLSNRAQDLERLSEAIDAYATLTASPGSPVLTENERDPDVAASLASESMQAIEAAAHALNIELTPATKRLLERQFSQMVRLHKHVSRSRQNTGRAPVPRTSTQENNQETKSSDGRTLSPEEEIRQILKDISKADPENAGALISYRPLFRLRELLNQYYPQLRSQISNKQRYAALKNYRRQLYLKKLANANLVRASSAILGQKQPQLIQPTLPTNVQVPVVTPSADIGTILKPSVQGIKLVTRQNSNDVYAVLASGEKINIERTFHRVDPPLDLPPPEENIPEEEDNLLTYVVRRPVHKYKALGTEVVLPEGPTKLARPAVVESGRFSKLGNQDRVPSLQDELDKIVTESGLIFLPNDKVETIDRVEAVKTFNAPASRPLDAVSKEVADNTDLLGILGPEFPNRLLPSRKSSDDILEQKRQRAPPISVQNSSPLLQLNQLLLKAQELENTNETPLDPQDFFKRFFEVTANARKKLLQLQNNSVDGISLSSQESALPTTTTASIQETIYTAYMKDELKTTTPSTPTTTGAPLIPPPPPDFSIIGKSSGAPIGGGLAQLPDFSIVLNTPDYLPPGSGPKRERGSNSAPSLEASPPSFHVGPPGLKLAAPAPVSPPGFISPSPPATYQSGLSASAPRSPSDVVRVPTAFVTSHRELSQSVLSPPLNSLPGLPASIIYDRATVNLPSPQLPFAPAPSSSSYDIDENDPFNPKNWEWGGQPTDPDIGQYIGTGDRLSDTTTEDLIQNFPAIREPQFNTGFSWDYRNRPINLRPSLTDNFAALDSFSTFSSQVLPPASDYSKFNFNTQPWSQDWYSGTEFKRKSFR